MHQHVLDDGIRPFAVLLDLVEVGSQRLGQLVDFGAGFIVELSKIHYLLKLI